MEYKRPRLAMVFGSLGGYQAFHEATRDLYGEIVKEGALYFVEHAKPYPMEKNTLEKSGMDLTKDEVREGRELTKGFHFYSGIRDLMEKPPGIAIRRDENTGALYFHDFKTHMEHHEMFRHQMIKAWEAGYRKDMLLSFMSGWGFDGHDLFPQAQKIGSSIIIQEPKTAIEKNTPNSAIQEAEMKGISYEIFPPQGIGKKILEFLSLGGR
ncbi:MAG: hypothetical protein GTN37_02640 [Candidatus Aenigmarchaeota archaeon]|nr:hypothetical protein [Candidatus Aenigmarchaeota archaeon]NIQ17881.1 hypothetical protein [Candidatus Aenigmarchaeota archaeon]NIS73301.1 hypothetical protein [Candidatus Aenigmarchaeota archaeon]